MSEERRQRSRRINRVGGYVTIVLAAAALALMAVNRDFESTTYGVPSWLLATALIVVGVWMVRRPPSF